MFGMASRVLSSVAQRVPFRLALAAVTLALHVWIVAGFARDRYVLPLNTQPGEAPVFVAPGVEQVSKNWDRLAVSRWDSAHYISLLLRGYSQCPNQDLRTMPLPGYCNFNFYPGYPALGWVVRSITRLPADYSLLLLSLGARMTTINYC